MYMGREGWACVTSRAAVAQTTEKSNAGLDRKVSHHTVHRSLLCVGLHIRRPVRACMWPPLMNHVFFDVT